VHSLYGDIQMNVRLVTKPQAKLVDRPQVRTAAPGLPLSP